jgi:predicted MFS family arabinose efflux permease
MWSVRPVRWTFAGTLTARLAQTMVPLTLLLLFRQRPGGFALAGAAVAVYGLASAAGGPVVARLADRHGKRVLLAAGGVNATALALLAAAKSPAASWVILAAVGVSVPPLGATLRAAVAAYLPCERDRAAAFSLDAISTEILFVGGPALVAAAVAIGAPADALLVAAGLVLVGSTATALTTAGRSQAEQAAGTPTGRPAARLAGLLAPWLAIAAAQMAAIGCVLLLLVAGGFSLVAAAQSIAWLYPVMFVAGLACAPAATALVTSFSRATRAASRSESFAWLASSSNLGGSAGYAAAGLLLAHTGITSTLLAGTALPIAGAAAALGRVRSA